MAQTPSSPLNATTIAAATEGAEGGEKKPCIYAKTRSHSQQIKEAEQILELFNLLRTGSENQALDSLWILRSHNNVENVLDIIKARRSQEKRTRERERAPISTSQLGIESELMTRNVVTFPPLQTIESNVIKLTLSRAALSTGRLSTAFGEERGSPSDSEADQFSAHHPTNIKRPISLLHPCDERLEELNMSFWTSVSISNDVAAKIISLYLETDHPLLGTFEPDLFVDDLTNCRVRHCSPLLVSAIMYWGCQMYSGIDPSIKEYIAQFCEEAEYRWADEKANDCLLNLASTPLLGLAYLGDGKDHYILTYVSEANAMATRMGLLGVDPAVAASEAQEITPALQNATSSAAWSTFNWIVLMSLFYQQPGLAYPEYPPVLPIPGYVWLGAPTRVLILFDNLCSRRIWVILFQPYVSSSVLFMK
ncbi:Nitrogen assimilation transcription factor nit-4-like protein 1 [Fusarium oxysporum f. sp. phaseoli]